MRNFCHAGCDFASKSQNVQYVLFVESKSEGFSEICGVSEKSPYQ